MNATLSMAVRRESLWSKALWKFRHDRVGMAAFVVVCGSPCSLNSSRLATRMRFFVLPFMTTTMGQFPARFNVNARPRRYVLLRTPMHSPPY